jgi:hypothetical protein
MTCEELQFELSFYLEDELTPDARQSVATHLGCCPLCRAKLADHQDLSRELRTAVEPAMSDEFVSSLQNTLRVELAVQKRQPVFSFREKLQSWLEPRLLPYGVGTFASLALFSLLTLGIMLPASDLNDREKTVMPLASLDGATFRYAAERSDVGRESPSLNPNGALVAMASAMKNSGGKNKEIVLVADVFSNGIARINEVVQPSPDEKTMRALEKAMEEVPDTSAFVPARLDKRSDVVQIILKIHEVDVHSDDVRPVRRSRSRSRQVAMMD